jgi:hypothetical protein
MRLRAFHAPYFNVRLARGVPMNHAILSGLLRLR